jgi:hypothetical protein
LDEALLRSLTPGVLGVLEALVGRRRGGRRAARRPGGPRELDDSLPRHTAVAAYLHERDGDLATAARLYARAAEQATNVAERDHLIRQAARLNAGTR